MACYYIVISSTHLRDGQLRSIKGVFRGPIGAGGRKNNQTDEGASSNLYCELCDKQYVRQQQFDNHINSYDHHHKQRLKELKQREFHRAAACRRQREERRDERLLRKRLRHRSRREDKADRRRALGSGPMFRSTTVAVEPASATEKDSSHGAGAPGPDPQSSPGSGLASDTRHPSQRRNANIVTPGDITPENGAAGQSGAFRKLPWATAFFSDSIRANNNNNNDDEPANSKNKAFAANRGRPVCFSLPKRSCVLLHRAAAVFIQAGRSSRDSKTTTRDEKQISSTPCVRAQTRELDDKLKGILTLCDRRRGTGAQVHAGGGTAAQDGSGSRLGAKVSGNQDLRVIDGRLTGAQSSTGDQSKEGGMTRAQNGRQSPTVQSSGGSGTWAEDRSRTDGECGPGARTRAPSCGQTATETEVTRGCDGSGTGVRLVGPSATGPRISRGTTSGAHFTGDRDLGGTGAVPFHGLGARVIQEGGGIGTGARATWQSGAALEIMLRCAARDQDGAGVAVGSATGAEGCRQNETGNQKGGARRTGTGAENGTESLRSGTGSRPTAAGHRAPSGDPPPPLPFKCQSPAFETSDKPDLDELRHFSALLQKAKSEKQAQDSSPKRTPTWPPGRPSEPFCPVLSRDGSRVLLWPSEMLRRTRTSPSLSYSVNPLLYDFRAHARGRGREVGGIKSAVIKRAGRQCKRERGGGGGEAKSDESRDENRGGQAGNPLQAAGRGTAGKAGAAFTHAHASKSTRAGLRRRRRKRRKRKRGRRKSAEETSGKGQRGSGIRSALGKMARLERDDVATDERREKQRLSRLAARRLLEGPQKRRRPEEEEAEEERIVRNDALLCRLPAKRRNRSKRANAGAGPQSSSGWGPALTKLLCGGAISPAPRTPRCPEITAPPAGTDTGPGRKHGDGRECGPENDGRGKPTEIKAREASACEAAMSVASPPRRDAAGRRQIRLKCDAAISPVPLSFGALARARRQTAAEGPIGSCDAQKQESTPGIPSATLACQDLWREVTGRRKRKCTERPQSVAGKKGKAGPRRSGLERTLDSTETSEGSSEETRPSHFSPDGTDSAHRDNALDAAVVDTPSEDAARDDHGIQRQHGSEETRPSHFSPDGTDSARQGNALDAAVVDMLSEDAARDDHGSEGTRPSHFSPDGTDSSHRDNALDAAVVDTPSEDAARHDHGVQRQHGSEGTNPSHFWPDGTVKTCQDSNHSAVHSVDSIVVDAPAEDIIKRGHGSEATGPSHSSPDGNAERPDAHETRPPSCLDLVTERFGPARTAPHGCRRCHPRIQRVDSPHAELIDAPPADAPVSDPELPPSDGVPHREKDKMSAACSANEEHASGKRQRGRSAEPASLGKGPRFSLGLPPGCLPLGAPLLLPPPSSFSFRRSIIQHHLSVVAPPLPLPSYQHLLPAFAPHPVALNPAPPSFLASPAIHVLDASYPLATEFHPMLSQHHAALLAPPHPPALSLQVLF